MTTVTTFSPQNDAASRASTTYYSENLVLVVVLVLESKGLLIIQLRSIKVMFNCEQALLWRACSQATVRLENHPRWFSQLSDYKKDYVIAKLYSIEHHQEVKTGKRLNIR